MGADDPRLNTAGKIDFRIARMIAAWKKDDPPPNRVKPIPLQVIRRIAYVAQQLPPGPEGDYLRAIADMIIIGFFFLLRPGEYTDAPSDTTPFTLADVQLFCGPTRLDLHTSSDAMLNQALFSTLTFGDQKNAVRNEVIGLKISGDTFLCPVKALIRRVLHLRSHGAPLSTPLARVFSQDNIRTRSVTPTVITKTLRDAVRYIGFDLGFLPSDVSARSLRAAGATALLVANVDTDIIRLLGRWRSDEMLRYLHVSSEAMMASYSAKMLNADYSLLPNALVPCH